MGYFKSLRFQDCRNLTNEDLKKIKEFLPEIKEVDDKKLWLYENREALIKNEEVTKIISNKVFAGKVTISDTKKKREVIDTNSQEAKTYFTPFGSRLTVHEGDVIEAGDEITEGSIYPQDIMRIKGPDGVQKYIVQEVQKVYRSQGVDIDDRHIEAIIRQMLKKVKVEEPGDTSLLPGTMVDYVKFEEENAKAVEAGLRPAVGKRVLLGITKASLATDSFLSAASFQETTKVLTEAAIKGKVDPLIGLKENVIIGKLIPAGTGLMRYRKMQPVNAETGEPTAKTVPEHIEE